ncbi:hypothetical protein PHYSODRAFT_248535 [Phytophthora sojae]|uniref:Enoyl reductase (ER) domain-containing protein n=1 Tax=Phytophthora sojae (strain P6497) TaxID=1094619 RepID=G4YFB5_PHYSP|nr:hypothetical protein PHYSODRAFT_248535 [Phytophthora sojae]EGZ28341.1 hypothetical protein PHYSODRAFT_248535 [Phytophthora sojae]|eukprot:XP_009515616.1 hypothetical protein PHYSODRAFT_248535 [Phytophthora sojae]
MVFPQTYRAYQYDHYGPIEDELKLRSDLPQKALASNQVRVKVHSASVNPLDYKLVEVMGQMMLGRAPSPEQPFAIGHDAAGEVVEVGSDVKRFKVGDAVYASATGATIGSLSEYWVLDEDVAAAKPKNLNFNEAAAVPSVAITAYAGVTEHAKLQRGDTILVLGGSSSVGMFVIQHDIGARVIATTSSRNVELIKSLGADQVVDYTEEKWVDVLPPHSVDAVFDCWVEPSAWNDGA